MAVEAPDIGVPLQCGAKRKVNAAVGRETCAGPGNIPVYPLPADHAVRFDGAPSRRHGAVLRTAS